MKKKKIKRYTKLETVKSFILSTMITLMVLEIMVRILPIKWTKINYDLVNEERIFSSSKDMKFRPNLTRTWTGLGRPTIWHFNDLGFRERGVQLNKPDNIYRIAFIGDSIVMGFGVEEYETVSRQLEDLLRPQKLESGMTHFEVLNLGIQGYSTPQYLAVLKEDAIRMKPEVVVVGLYTNDILGSVSFNANKRYMLLRSIPDAIPYSISQFLKKNSKLYLFFLTKYYSIIEKTQVNTKFGEEYTEVGWQNIRSDFGKMASIAKQHNIRLIVLGIPNSALEVEKNEVSKRRVEELTRIANDNKITYYELYNDLAKYTDKKRLYLEDYDDHFSIEGNKYVAKLIGTFLQKESIIPVATK